MTSTQHELSQPQRLQQSWLNRTVIGIGLASLFSDWSHEIATTVLPAFLATLGGAAAWLGFIEGLADGLSSFAKMASGYYTDRLRRRKPIAVLGYIVTALGTASFGLATAAWQVAIARALAWCGRGVRTPVRKALLAGAVQPATYGRAFGFERMMDTCGAIVGPATAVFLLQWLHGKYPALFAFTLVPSLLATAMIAFVVKEKMRMPVPHITFRMGLRLLPHNYRRFLLAVALFGAGDFAHTLLILLATQRLADQLGMARAASTAAALYVVHNIAYAASAYAAGWLGDRFNKQRLLALGYALAAAMAVGIILVPPTRWAYALVFVLGGIYVGMEETLEDALCATLVAENQHGMAFGVLATINGIGDFISSVVVGALWTGVGLTAAFGYSAFLFAAGALLMLRVKTPPVLSRA